MAAPNMATITASLERSLQNCSLSHHHHHHHNSSSTTSSTASSGGGGVARPPDSAAAAPTLDLNSEGALPFHWEQCLDLKVLNPFHNPSLSLYPKTDKFDFFSRDRFRNNYGGVLGVFIFLFLGNI